MTTYTATLAHHSIGHSPNVTARSLPTCKRKASQAFDGGFRDHQIKIYEETEGYEPRLVASRFLSERRWTGF